MINASLDEIQKLLLENKLDAKPQTETEQLLVTFKLHESEFPMFIKVVHDRELVQILIFIPAQLDKNHVSDVGRMLHFINKEMDLPGFGCDEQSAMIFYRLLYPAQNKKLDKEIFLAYVNAAKIAVETFAPVIQSINIGKTRFKDVLQQISLKK